MDGGWPSHFLDCARSIRFDAGQQGGCGPGVSCSKGARRSAWQAGEGASYDGIKPTVTVLVPEVVAADQAMATGMWPTLRPGQLLFTRPDPHGRRIRHGDIAVMQSAELRSGPSTGSGETY